jgi:phosphatidate cytidylyltransferase
MLRWRLLSAGVILCLLLSLVVLDFYQAAGAPPGAWLFVWLLLITVLGTEECLSLLAAKDLRPVQWPIYCGTLGVTLAFGMPILHGLWPAVFPAAAASDRDGVALPLLALALAIILIMVAEMRRFQAPGQHIVLMALAIFTVVYVGMLGGFMTALRIFKNDNGRGMTALFSMVVVVKCSDIGAYTIGRIFGRNKMTPKLSPGKTVEGAFGGIAGGCLASWAFFQFVAPQLMNSTPYTPPGWLSTTLYGFILAIAAMIGDLAESLLKRDMGRKDSSTWLPGLGGVLDIIDSLLVGAPAAYLCWQLGVI